MFAIKSSTLGVFTQRDLSDKLRRSDDRLRFTRKRFERHDGSQQVSHRFGLHFFHHPRPVYLHRALRDAKIEGDLLVQLAFGDHQKDIVFARR